MESATGSKLFCHHCARSANVFAVLRSPVRSASWLIAKSAAEISSVSAAPPHAFDTDGMYLCSRYLSSDGRCPIDITAQPSLLRSCAVGTVAARTNDFNDARTSYLSPPNAVIAASAMGAGSPFITCVPPPLCVQRSQTPLFWSDWLSSDCAMSDPICGSSNVTSCSCER